MLYCLEVADGLPDSIRGTAHQRPHTNRSQHIFDVVQALQRDFGNRHDLAAAAGVAEEDFAISGLGSLLNFFRTAEPEDPATSSLGQFRTCRVILVQHYEVISRLVLENSSLGVGIDLESSMAVEMIGRDVKNDRDFRTEGLNGLQLETRNLQHRDALTRSIFRQ